MESQKVTFGEKLEGISYRRREGVYAIIMNDKNDAFAAVKTSTGYFLPGGGMEANETHEGCLKREVLEELGCQIAVGPFIGRAERYFYSTTLHEHTISDGYFYTAQIVSHPQAPTEDDHEFVWIRREEAEDLLFHEHQVWAVIKTFQGIGP